MARFAHLVEGMRRRHRIASRRELAARIGITEAALRDALAGRRVPYARTVARFAAFLERPVDDVRALLGPRRERAAMPRSTPLPAELSALLARLTTREQSLIARHARELIAERAARALSTVSRADRARRARRFRQQRQLVTGQRARPSSRPSRRP